MNKHLVRSQQARKITFVGFFVNALLSILKLVAGKIGKSNAMIADGVHSLSDFLTDIVVLVGFKLTSKPEDECHNYGHDKYETFATVIISIALAIAGYQIMKNGIVNVLAVIKGEKLAKPSIFALIAAIISVMSKELLYRYTLSAGKEINSPAITANAWHHRSDAFSSIGTMIGITGSIILGDNWTILDPIASIVVSIFIFKVSYDILVPSVDELLEKSLDKEDRVQVIDTFNQSQGVEDYHQIRMRKVGSKAVIEGHILVNENLNISEAHCIAHHIENKLKNLLGHDSIITIHIEPFKM